MPTCQPAHFVIHKVFQRLGEVERVGAGVRKMRDALRAAGLKAPKFEFSTFFTITFWRPEAGPVPAKTPHVAPHVTPHVRKLLEFCAVPRSRGEIQEALGISDRKHLRAAYLAPAISAGWLAMTRPGKPKSVRQRYVTTGRGSDVLESIGRRTRAGQEPAAGSRY